MRALPFTLVAVAAVATAASATNIAGQAIPAPASTRDIVHVRGQTIAYRVTASETAVDGPGGRPGATIFSTAYLRETDGSGGRPVMFLFNGGPGAPTVGLHEAFGPRHFVAGPPDAKGVVHGVPAENGSTPLDMVDLVFIDPVGTGYSRVLPGAKGSGFWGVKADADATATFIRRWLAEHGRTASPILIAGESYGGLRSVIVADELTSAASHPINLRGLLLISPSTGGKQRDADDSDPVDVLPSMAAVAWYYHRGSYTAEPLAQVMAEARRFAETDYRQALLEGGTIAPAHASQIAAKLAAFSGLDAAGIMADNLRIKREHFLTGLLADQGERIGLVDGRDHQPLKATAAFTPPYNDPSSSRWKVRYDARQAFEDYYRDRIGYRPLAPYVWLSLEANKSWDWALPAGYEQGTGVMLGRIMTRRPAMRVLVTLGTYDLTIPERTPSGVFERADLPPDRFRLTLHQTGHAVFNDDQARAAAMGELGWLMADRAPAGEDTRR